jgi:competence protein ComEA
MFKKFLVALAALIAATAFAVVDANKASQAELDSVKGIGPAISTRISDERKKGEFKDWSDMKGLERHERSGQGRRRQERRQVLRGRPDRQRCGLRRRSGQDPGVDAGESRFGDQRCRRRAASATKATAAKAASAVKGGAAIAKKDVKEAKEKRTQKKAEKAAAAASAASATKK